MKPKRAKRRLEREKEFGPERDIVSFSTERAVLSCGHVVLNPRVQKTVHMRLPKVTRCIECKNV